MNFYNKLNLREKIIFMMMMVSFTVLGITNILYVSLMIPNLKDSMENEYSNYAQLIGDSIIGSLLFADTETANEILSPLSNQKSIVGVVIYDENYQYFVGYGEPGNSANVNGFEPKLLPTELKVHHTFLQSNLYITSPIRFDNSVIGYIHLDVDVTDRNAEFYSQLVASLITFLISLFLAYVLAKKLQAIVTQPVNHIVSLMNKVSDSNDFSVRSNLRTNDELSRLGEGFNDMLSRIESRDRELNSYKTSLEQKVESRTQQLHKATEEANAATDAKSDFLAKMSHEIRTPLNAIIGFSKLTLRSGLQSKQRENLSKILDSSETLLGLINDILDFSKIEAGKLELENVEFSLEKVMQRSMGVVGLKAYEKNLELITYIAPDVPNYLKGDPLRLQQIIINLCTNGVKFTETGSVSVLVNLLPSQSGTKLKIAVSDTGIGISQERQDNLFQSFSQADNTITRKYGGTGLGLTICKQLVELMGGEISVSSDEGKGAVFTFTIKFDKAETKQEQNKYAMALSGMDILIVDDNSLSRKVISDSLAKVTGNIETAGDGLEALNKVQSAVDRKKPYDLIIMDWKMPNMDGLEAAKIIRRDLGQETPEILMVSAYDKEEVMPEARKHGLFHFLEKPFTASSLVDYLGEMLSGIEPDKITHVSELIAPNLAGNCILLVEDNKLNQQVATGFLAEMNLEIDIAENGQIALDKLASANHYDLVLMDVQMPLMDGLTATKKIREELKSNIPIVAMTAHAMDEDTRKSKAAGMDEHLSKPIDLQALYSILTSYLKSSSKGNVTVDTTVSTDDLNHDKFVAELKQVTELNFYSALNLFNGKVEMLKDFVYEFMSNNELIDELKTAVEKVNIEVINRVSHTLKNQLAYLGAIEVRDMAKELEVISNLNTINTNVVVHSAETLVKRLNGLVQELNMKISAITRLDVEFDGDVCLELLAQIIVKSDMYDIKVEKISLDLSDLCRDTRFQKDADQIVDYAKLLEFKKVLELAKSLKTNIENS